MFRFDFAALAVLVALAASPVAAHPFESFARLCIDNGGDRVAAHAGARRAGWTELPQDALGEPNGEIRDARAFMNFDPNKADPARPPETVEILVTGWGSGVDVMGIEGLMMDLCAMMSPSVSRADLEARMTALIQQPVMQEGEFRLWLYSRDGEKFVSEAALVDISDEDLRAAARRRQLYVVYVMEEGGIPALVMGAVRATQ